ncbi:MAG TPA: exodeoxyribonuclease VII large subunit [Candidatus Sumerlaeota bacterium]|nr:exodeoxyribonuclease VII large subunit [Candidatus Sumerlaeota bacterium]
MALRSLPAAQPPRPLSVTELTRAIRRAIETQLGAVTVEGEISNWTLAASGHAYFSLKDPNAVISCVMFRNVTMRLPFKPGDGTRVVARGAISVYEPRGQYQLVVSALEQAGLGDLYRRFLELKAKLEQEGLFDPARKRPLPPMPTRIGVVTSASGAVLRDIVNVIRRRFSGVSLLLSPTLVQGAEAPASLLRALDRLYRWHANAPEGEKLDLLIVARGGGSLEDLWAFNDEAVCRAVAASPIPAISAVGHETDFTLCDFVADLRAPTPSAAAEVAVPESELLDAGIAQLRLRLRRALESLVQRRRLELARPLHSWGLRQPLELVRQAIQRLDELQNRAQHTLERQCADSGRKLDILRARLDNLNPQAVLQRGYSIVSRSRDNRVLTRDKQVRVGDHLRIQLAEGELRASVIPRGEDFLDGWAPE